ncbi:hypothetical protein PIB30_094456 [Stylosanthes scabra]|uniref:Uncharacterized protein n=1 Tax=Stylosanthes scabra TaxID=79078 RepID=A0ABU6RVV2_9FABA|nr:hypothetical protein [Stylosanthes scabra]
MYEEDGVSGFGCVLRDNSGSLSMAAQGRWRVKECSSIRNLAKLAWFTPSFGGSNQAHSLYMKLTYQKLSSCAFCSNLNGGNRVADWLAKKEALSGVDSVEWLQPPDRLLQVMPEDLEYGYCFSDKFIIVSN